MPLSVKDAVRNAVPALVPLAREVRGVARAQYCRWAYRTRAHYRCPICGYHGPFDDFKDPQYPIRQTLCPRCDLYERHRLLLLVMNELGRTHDFARMSILHFAPEPWLEKLFRRRFGTYHTADIAAHGVDFAVDMCRMAFADASYDVVLASHVLEHIQEDRQAVAEVRRILKPGGLALLPVPVVSPRTIEYPHPNPHEFGHVRAIGTDFFDRYREAFSSVRVWSSADFDEVYQLYTWEDRTGFPSSKAPHRVPMPGERHTDYVPVCYR